MKSDAFQPDDPRFLLSRGLDDDLSAAERRALEALLADSASLRREAEELAATDRLVKRWGAASAEVDWKTHAELTAAEVRGELTHPHIDAVDGLIQRWGRHNPSRDEGAFTKGVLARIGAEQRGGGRYGYLLRLGVPLAAAAAIALSVVGPNWFVPAPRTVCLVDVGPAAMHATAGSPRVVVSFVPSAEGAQGTAGSKPSIGTMTLGADSSPGFEEASPL